MCPDCGRPKMLFETERKAMDFIKWNGDEINVPDGYTLRVYYCPSCCGYHISHQKYWRGYDNSTKRLLDAYQTTQGKRHKIDSLIHGIDFEREAERIYSEMPDGIRQSNAKKPIREWLTEYFAEHEIQDAGGGIRHAVYKKWQNDMLTYR